MNQEIFDWVLLLGRWLHITTAITWIGTSIFFMWLDRTFEFNENSKSQGHVGDLWMVHGGGFYHVEKLQMGPTKVPNHLHWFGRCRIHHCPADHRSGCPAHFQRGQ